jgi:hypothetical protein
MDGSKNAAEEAVIDDDKEGLNLLWDVDHGTSRVR